ncbi:hypothetical protein HDU81_000884, partial [Chytriomyces hyalinus]
VNNSNFESFSLAYIAKQLSLPSKLEMGTFFVNPEDTSTDLTNTVIYCAHDAYLHVAVALKTNVVASVLTMAGNVIEWYNEPPGTTKYQGGYVMNPVSGRHKDVKVFDYSSLYPSIVESCNISSETVQVIDRDTDLYDRYLSLYEFDDTKARLGVTQYAVGVDAICIMIGMEMGLIHQCVKQSPLGDALKIAANSYYGALGSSTSGLGLRFAAASVTLRSVVY